MRRPWVVALAIALLVFIIFVFLNCGREANAIPRREQVKRNKVTEKYLVVHSQQQQRLLAGQAVDCERVESTYVHENYLGNRLFSLSLVGRWCYEGGEVVSLRWNSDHHIGNYWWSNWRWEGVSGPPLDTGGKGMRYAFRRIRGTFAVNVLWFERNVTPYVQCTVRGDGSERCGKGD